MSDRSMTPSPATPDLLPCPFCGSKDVSLGFSTNGDGTREYALVECESCGAMSGNGSDNLDADKQEAVTRWNTRASVASLRARKAELERDLLMARGVIQGLHEERERLLANAPVLRCTACDSREHLANSPAAERAHAAPSRQVLEEPK